MEKRVNVTRSLMPPFDEYGSKTAGISARVIKARSKELLRLETQFLQQENR